jgi:hypothetical protein
LKSDDKEEFRDDFFGVLGYALTKVDVDNDEKVAALYQQFYRDCLQKINPIKTVDRKLLVKVDSAIAKF